VQCVHVLSLNLFETFHFIFLSSFDLVLN